MILNDEEVNERLSSDDNLYNQIRVVNIYSGLKRSGPPIPQKVKELIADMAQSEPRADVAAVFGVGERTVENYKHGVNGSNRIIPELVKANEETKIRREDKSEKAHSLAIDALMDTLGALKPQIPAISSPKDLSKIARDMSMVANNLRPKEKDPTTANVQVVLMTVNQKTEADFEAITV